MNSSYTEGQMTEARELYVSGSCRTLRDVAIKTGITTSVLGTRSSLDRWCDDREQEQLRRYHLGERSSLPQRALATASRSREKKPTTTGVTIDDMTPDNKQRALNALARIKDAKDGVSVGLALMKQTMSMERSIRRSPLNKRTYTWQP